MSIASVPSAEQPVPSFLADVLSDNLRSLGLAVHTLQAITDAEPDAQLVLLPSGDLAVRTAAGFLDTPSEVAVPSEADAVIVVFGLGAGNTVRAARAQTQGRIVIFEPDPNIARAVLEHGPLDLGDVELVTDLFDLGQIWQSIAQSQVTATVLRTPGYTDRFPEEERALVQKLEELVARVGVNVNTFRTRARVWVEDLLDNLELLVDQPTFLALAGALPGVPAFIVGAGPSLGKNGPLLSEASRKGLVISVNTSAQALASYGVEPQVLACLESVDVSHLIRDLPFMDRVVRAFSLTAHPKTLRTGEGPLLPVYEAMPEISGPMSELTGHVGLPVCGSVTTAAFSLAQRLGCNPIVLVGQDLAYTDGQTYAPGTAYSQSKARVSEDGTTLELDWCETLLETHNAGTTPMHEREAVEWVPAWGGDGIVPTGMSFSPVRAWFGDAARVLQREQPALALINATEGGARIDGFAERSLWQVLADLPEHQVTPADLKRMAEQRMRRVGAKELASFLRGKAESAGAVGRAARSARKLADAALEAMRQGKREKIAGLFAELERAEHALRGAVRAAPLVDTFSFAAVDEVLTARGEVQAGDAADEARESLAREAAVARVISRAAKQLRDKFLSVATQLESTAESRPTPQREEP